jgi:hypothetical protein
MPLPPFVTVPKLGPDGRPVFGKDGRPIVAVGIYEPKNHVRGYWLVSDPITVTLAPGGQDTLRYLIDQQGHFDWAYILGTSDGPYTLSFFDGGTQRRLSNKPVHSVTIVGSGARPFRLPEPYFFDVGDNQRELEVTVMNPLFTENTIRLVLYGRRFYHREAPPAVAKKFQQKFQTGWRTYSYFLVPNETKADGDVDPVPALGSASFTFESESGIDTDLHKLMVDSTGAFTFQIRERATNRTLQNGIVDSVNGFGNAEFPFYFADSYLLERKMQLLLEVTDTSGAPNKIFATMAGRRLQYR